ncbi:MAG: hypothetical protein FJ026_18600 [Chloroflexi bacterium]|nr:hypothetical protein [Chloroflexota bacterium]
MRKVLIGSLVIFIVLGGSWAALAAEPGLQAATAKIVSPGDNAVVRGTVPIVGTAVDPAFWKYEVHYGPEPNPLDRWTLIGIVHENQVGDGLLETWDTGIIPDGTYTLRLRVVNRTGNYQEVFARGVLVANAAPTNTPEPTQTATPTATITPAATPTFMIPTSPLAQPTATPTLARPTRSALPGVLDVSAWRQSLCLGAELMAILLVVLALIFLLRRAI